MSYEILNRIESPGDVRGLSPERLPVLAQEVRQKIIEVVSKTGGHLAPSLGVVELTVALYSIFDFPPDKVIWDVGHQGYPHKLLTGRRDRFSTLRQFGGVSGFLRRQESPYDLFGAGHASTSLSAALGFAKERDLRRGKEHVVAVIGDGALTGGVALEALNNIGFYKTNLLVILNDNEFSISRNVGSLARHLMKLRTFPIYRKVEKEVRELIKSLPFVGSSLDKVADQIDQGLVYLTAPGKTGVIFEEFGFRYIGPIDGHDVHLLREHFMMAKEMEGPVLIHAVTVKGKGCDFAEKDACLFHGVTPFDTTNGKMEKKAGAPPAYTKVFGDTLVSLAKEDRRVVAICAAMPDGTGLRRFSEEIPDRYFDVGIAEEHGVLFAAGLAAAGMKPVVAIYSTFLQRAFDQIVHDVCLQNLPVVFALDRGGLVGEDGATHHGILDHSYLGVIPNMALLAPKDENELRHMLKTAIDHNGPVAIRYPRGAGLGVPMDEVMRSLPWGKSEVLREGKDLAILAAGRMASVALRAATVLSHEGIHATVVNLRFLKPLDEDLILRLARETGALVTLEESAVAGGVGSRILLLLQERGVQVPVRCLGVPDRFIEHGATHLLLKELALDEEGVRMSIKDFLSSLDRKVILMGEGVEATLSA